MAKDKNNAPDTIEAALVIIENLNTELAASNTLNTELKGTVENLNTELEASNEVAEALKAVNEEQANELDQIKANHAIEMDSVQAKVQNITKNVPGTYKSKAHNKTIRFKDGFVNTRVNPETIVPSAELIKNKGGNYTDFLDRLIAIGFAGIEEVK